MEEVLVPIFVESRYKINRKRIRSLVNNLLKKKGVVGKVEVSIAIVGDRKMRSLSKKYKGEDKTRNVLSFSQAEGERVGTSSDVLFLGDVVISYPEVIREAAAEEVLVDEKIGELVEHGIMHLLGINHE
ncbi:MAG: rRNA maturation RNase YbeY [Candidatus Levybacteria bacterium RIFCSPLOWO2_01_FULL_38_21]|nr:MAG: rRNA maturation RNase YbeY [Candidatus Levybacteria bacterium RIFCSPLOWO2_01_FULL_38_21]